MSCYQLPTKFCVHPWVCLHGQAEEQKPGCEFTLPPFDTPQGLCSEGGWLTAVQMAANSGPGTWDGSCLEADARGSVGAALEMAGNQQEAGSVTACVHVRVPGVFIPNLFLHGVCRNPLQY